MKLTNAAIISLILVLSAAVSQAATHQKIGTAGPAILNHQSNARLTGMGGAGVAIGDDIATLSLNPAGLGAVAYPEIYLNHQSGLEGIDDDHVAFVLPLTGATSANWDDFGTLGVSAEILDYGDIAGRDGVGNVTGSFGAEEKLYSLAYGKRLVTGLSVGGKMKYYHFSVSGVSEGATAADAGMRYQPYRSPWAVGAMVQNIGSSFKLQSNSFDLPQNFIAGVALFPFGERLTFAADYVDPKYDSPGLRGGLEYWVNASLGLRGGYTSLPDAGSGVSAGVSIQVSHFEAWFFPIRRLRLDYSIVLANQDADGLENTNQVSLSFQFGEDGGVSR